MKHTERNMKSLLAVVVVLGLALLAPASASAHFVRPFVRAITGTCENPGESPPLCTGGKFVPFGFGPLGLGVDAEGNLWAGDTPPASGAPNPLDEFEPSGAFAGALNLPTQAESLAVDLSTGAFYTGEKNGDVTIYSKAGVPEGTIPIEHGVRGLAFDDSAGSLYVVNPSGTEPDTLFKFNAAGVKQNFAGCPTCSSYVSGNEITGTPTGAKLLGEVGGLAVDPANGDIYVTTQHYEGQPGAVFEYSRSGEFIRTITGSGVLRPPGSKEGGFGGEPRGLAVDPTNGDLLLALNYLSEFNGKVDAGAVDEFDSSGRFLGQVLEAEGRPLSGADVLTLDSHGHLYVVNRTSLGGAAAGAGSIDVYEEGGFAPALRLAAATQRKQTSAVLNGSVNAEATLNPEKAAVSDCRFEYVTEAAFNENVKAHGGSEQEGFSSLSSGGQALCSPEASKIPIEPEEYVPVQATVTEHIVSGVTYRYRLSATLAGAHGAGAHTAALAFTAPHAPVVSATAANDITSTFADFSGAVDPLGADTTYRFQYLTEAQFQASGETFAGASSTPQIDLGPGGEAGDLSQAVFQQVAGLQPETTYRFRLIASNELGVSEGEAGEGGVEVAHLFTTQAAVSPALPDGRAYELLTPPDKGGAEDMFREVENVPNSVIDIDHELGAASESGDQFILRTKAAFGPFPFSFLNAYVFSRHSAAADPGSAEWSYTSLASPGLGVQSVGGGGGVGAIEPFGFSRVAFNDEVGAPQSQAGVASASLLGPPGGPYTALHTDQARHDYGPKGEISEIRGGSSDLSLVVLASNNHALAAAAAGLDPGAPALYESTGALQCTAAAENCPLIDVTSGGQLLSKCGAALGLAVQNFPTGSAYRAVSADGSRVFFTAPALNGLEQSESLEGEEGCPNKKGENPPQLYLRSGGETLPVSRPAPGGEAGSPKYGASYLGAAADGSRVFFRSEGWLTADHPTVHDPELYEWRSAGAPECGESSPAYNPASQGCLARVSRETSGHAGAAVNTAPAVAADGSSVFFTAFGALAPGAEAHPPVPLGSQDENASPVNLYHYDTATASTVYIATVSVSDFPCQRAGLCPEDAYYATPDGRYLLFASHFQLTPEAHNAASSCNITSGGASGGYQGACTELYRYDAGAAALTCVSCDPSGAVPTSNALFTRSALEGSSEGAPRAISDDGSYVFFDTRDSLVPQDSNGALDVYEWHEGHISLLSSGTDPSPSFFLGASSDGHNVFIGTHSRLVPADTDSMGDVYDARICTAEEPCIKPSPLKEGLCEADACSHPAPAPNDATPASLAFTGPGNLVSALSPPPPPKPTAAQIRAKQLAVALKLCRKKANKHKRSLCEAQARKKYGPAKKASRAKRAITNGRAGG